MSKLARVTETWEERFCALAAVLLLSATSVLAIEPVVVWDGHAAGYKFDIRSRAGDGAYGDNTYTLNLNGANTVAPDRSYILIGPNNAQAGVTLTAQNSNPAVTNGFGTAGTVTVIMKCRNMPVTAGSNRAIITLMDGRKYKYGGTSQTDNGAVLGMYINNGTSGWIWKGSTADWSLSGDFLDTVSGAFSGGEQTVALTYSNTGGTTYYVNGEPVQANSGLKASAELAATYGVSLGGVDVDTGSQFYALTNMQISAVAVFAETLTPSEVAFYSAHGFPSDGGGVILSGDTNVSAINDQAGSASEIHVYVPDGAKIVGDATFTATTVHFYGDGEVVLSPSSSDAASFDFSNAAKPVIEYTSLPTVTGDAFTATTVPTWVTDSTRWTGVISMNGFDVTDFSVNPYGNKNSAVRLKNISGWLHAPGNYAFTNAVPVEIEGTLTINDGHSANDSNPNRCTVFKKISGSGMIYTESTAPRVVIVIQNVDDFTGQIGLNKGKFIVLGDAMPDYDTVIKTATVGQMFVMPGAKVANGGFWWATGGICVGGELCAAGLNKFGDATTITTSGTGVFTLTSTGNGDENETEASYARITGTGTLKYEGAGWRALSASNFPTTMTLENEQAGDLLLSRAQTYTVGSLSGSKNIQGNYGSGVRHLRVLQAKDTEWSGSITADAYSRFAGLTVAPGASSVGTLTLSGKQKQSAALTVEAGAKVNLTGTWKGVVTVYGEFGGSGTVDGDLIFCDGAKVKVISPLNVTGRMIAGQVSLVPRPSNLNGEEQGLQRTFQLVKLFGAGAVSEDGVTFSIGGLDVANGEIALDVSPSVAEGNTLSVMGKRELGDRWRRIMVNPEGPVVTIGGDDFAANRFFQVRAEEGLKSTGGYAVDETGASGNAAASEVTTHLVSTSTGRDVTLFTLALSGGEKSDYADSIYRTIDFKLKGVTPGALATLCTNGVSIEPSVSVGDGGVVSFTNLPQFSDGTTLSLGISSTNEQGLITTVNLAERAGVISYTWGGGETNTVDGCVTNVLTLLANKPVADGFDGDGDGIFRIPSIAKSTNGVVVVAYDCRHRDGGDLGLHYTVDGIPVPYNEGNCIDNAGNVSADGGTTWTPPIFFVDAPNSVNEKDGSFIADAAKANSFGDPCMVYSPLRHRFYMMGITGAGLSATYSHYPSGTSRTDVVLLSRDGDASGTWDSWSERKSVKIPILEAVGRVDPAHETNETNILGILQGPGHGISLRHPKPNSLGLEKGTLVFPMQYFPKRCAFDGEGKFVSSGNHNVSSTFAAWTNDGGDTWGATKIVDYSDSSRVDCSQENCIVELDDGSWVNMAKGAVGNENKRRFFRTHDYENWICETNLPSSASGQWVQGSCLWLGEAIKSHFGNTSRYVACYSTWGDGRTTSARQHITLFFGRDTSEAPDAPGITWDLAEYDFFPQATTSATSGNGFSYNSMVMLDDWTLGVVFESHGHIYLRKVNVLEVLPNL